MSSIENLQDAMDLADRKAANAELLVDGKTAAAAMALLAGEIRRLNEVAKFNIWAERYDQIKGLLGRGIEITKVTHSGAWIVKSANGTSVGQDLEEMLDAEAGRDE